jgi:SsrA-binding protein
MQYTKGNMSAQKKKPISAPKAVINRRARFDYELGDEIVAGVELTGPEVRAARDGHVQLKGSFVTVRNDELWLNNASFSLKLNQKGLVGARTIDTEPKKLLAHRKQIDVLQARKKDGMSIIPTRLHTTGRFIKLVIALGKGKKNYDKRETLKRRDQERDSKRAMKSL